VIEKVLSRALARGGDFAEVFAEEKYATGAVLDDGRVEELSSARDRGVGIRVVVGETTGFAHTADMSEAGLLTAAEAASAVARDSGPSESASLSVAGAKGLSKILWHPVDKDRKIDLLVRADEAARAISGSVKQVSASYGDSRRRMLVATSDGLLVGDNQMRTRFVVSCVAVGDTGMQTGHEVIAKTVGFELFDDVDVEELAAKAAHRAVTKLSARPAPSGQLPIVIAHGSGGVLFHEACGHGLEADHIVTDASAYSGMLGELVASPLITLVDDGTLGPEWGSFAIDDEGHTAQRNVLIENGILTDYMWDQLRARKEGKTSSGNGRRQSYRHLPMVRMTNTFIVNGTSDADEIVADTKSGVFVKQLGGGQVNTATGDFVFGTTEAYLIEDGQITEPLRDANLIGNGPEVLRSVDAVAGDFEMSQGTCGKDGQSVPVGCGQPTMRVSSMTIGGTANA